MGSRHPCDEDWEKEIEEFERTKAGVKGLVDSGVEKLPSFFIVPSNKLPKDFETSERSQDHQIPVIDFQGIEKGGDRRAKIIDEIRQACRNWGFFQMINHGVPINVINSILESTRKFHEQPKEFKMDLYSSDGRNKVRFYTINGKLKKSEAAGWRDAFSCTFVDDAVDPSIIPMICRNEVTDYMRHMLDARDILSELFSEALGLSSEYMAKRQFMKSEYLSLLYYPLCPEPDKAMGAMNHSDPTILTLLVQDRNGGLQVRHRDSWIDVPPIEGALIANIGDYLQLLTNDEFKSVEHRVLATRLGTRLSTACFFYPGSEQAVRAHGPIKEIVSERNNIPPLYREVNYIEFVTHYQTSVREDGSALLDFKVALEEKIS